MNIRLRLILLFVLLLGYVGMQLRAPRAHLLKEDAPPPAADAAMEAAHAAQNESVRDTVRTPANANTGSGNEPEKTASQHPLEQFGQELARLRNCWRENNCDFAEPDPRAAHFEAVGQIQEILISLRRIKLSNQDTDLGMYGREWMSFPDDNVREAALDLLALHGVSEENLSALADGMSASLSSAVWEKALDVLEKYAQAGYRESVSRLLEKAVRDGSLRAGETIARGALPFLTDDNVARFTAVARDLPPGSQARRDLEAAIAEFHRLRGGG